MAEWKVPELSSFCFHFIVSLVGNQWVVCYFFSHRDQTICNKNSFYASEHMGIDVAFSSFPPHAGSKWDELISEKIHSDIPEYVPSKLWQINNHSFINNNNQDLMTADQSKAKLLNLTHSHKIKWSCQVIWAGLGPKFMAAQ